MVFEGDCDLLPVLGMQVFAGHGKYQRLLGAHVLALRAGKCRQRQFERGQLCSVRLSEPSENLGAVTVLAFERVEQRCALRCTQRRRANRVCSSFG
jgi:hypothetical protein